MLSSWRHDFNRTAPGGGRYWLIVTDHPKDEGGDAWTAAVHARATGSVGATYNDARVVRLDGGSLPESGGTVGPLPDGAVIEVKPSFDAHRGEEPPMTIQTTMLALLDELSESVGEHDREHVREIRARVEAIDIDGIRTALEADSNDAEHDALVGVADVLGIAWVAYEDRKN